MKTFMIVFLNEYLIIKKSDGEVVDYRKWDGFEYKAVCEKTVRSTIFGDKIRPKDSYQACAIDSIFSNTMTAITGHAGSGEIIDITNIYDESY